MEKDREKHPDKDPKPKDVRIEVDNHPKHIPPGPYGVSDLKSLIGVPAEKDLDQVLDGNLTTLSDDSKVIITGGEVFFSHVRRGGSS